VDSRVRAVLSKVASTVEFVGVKFDNVNATNAFGDNALHCVCLWGDVESAAMLIDAGIDIEKFGDRGYTPLHIACMAGHFAVVELLVRNGADLFAQSKGELPLTTARASGHDMIFDYLVPVMKSTLLGRRNAYIKSRLDQLRSEISGLEAILG